MAQIKAEYGSVMRFVVTERLRWGEDVRPRGGPFEYAGKDCFRPQHLYQERQANADTDTTYM